MTWQILNFQRHNGTPGSTLLATCDICLDGKITICGARLVRRQNSNYTFLALPSRKVGTKYFPEVLLLDKQITEEITKEFMVKWRKSCP